MEDFNSLYFPKRRLNRHFKFMFFNRKEEMTSLASQKLFLGITRRLTYLSSSEILILTSANLAYGSVSDEDQKMQ